jgi:hypothetical protein
MDLPQGLLELIDRIEPLGLRVGYERHSDDAYTLWIPTTDGGWSFWRASRSLDDRWTLSPIY